MLYSRCVWSQNDLKSSNPWWTIESKGDPQMWPFSDTIVARSSGIFQAFPVDACSFKWLSSTGTHLIYILGNMGKNIGTYRKIPYIISMEVLSKIIELEDSPAMKLSTARPIDIAWRRSFHRLESKKRGNEHSHLFFGKCVAERDNWDIEPISQISINISYQQLVQILTATLVGLNAAEFFFRRIFRDGSSAVVEVVWFHMGKCATQINRMECHLTIFRDVCKVTKGFFCHIL